MATVYVNPETGDRKILGGGDRNRQAKELEAAGWVPARGTDVVGDVIDEPEPAEAENAADGNVGTVAGEPQGASGEFDLSARDDAEEDDQEQ